VRTSTNEDRVNDPTEGFAIADIEGRLKAEQHALLRDISAARAPDRDGASDPDERLEALEDHQRRHVALTRRLSELEEALARIADGTYGTCGSCAAPISAERLVALPTATLCVGCAATGSFLVMSTAT
jgi:RNA polymerase-binding transcription factor DksA